MSIFDCPSMHTRHTEPDEEGYGVCLDCGAPVSCGGVLTEAGFDDMVNAILRAPHTRRCVQLDDGWACPPECPTRPG